MEYMTFTGKTVSDALTAASVKLGVTSDRISYTVVDKGSAGIFGLGSKKAVIRAKVADSERESELSEASEASLDKAGSSRDTFSIESSASAVSVESRSSSAASTGSVKQEALTVDEENPSSQVYASDRKHSDHRSFEHGKRKTERKEKRSDAEQKEIEEIASTFLAELFATMKLEVALNFDFDEKNNTLNIDLSGPEMGVLIGKRGQTLDSLQYLTNLAINRKVESYIRVKIDTEDYRSRRNATLENLAKNVASKVKRSGRSESLEAMNPYERRVIHTALQGVSGIETHSEGEEPYRHVVITPKHE